MNWRTARKRKLRRDRKRLDLVLTLRGLAKLTSGQRAMRILKDCEFLCFEGDHA